MRGECDHHMHEASRADRETREPGTTSRVTLNVQFPRPLVPLFVLLAGFALRLYRLGVESLWYDETVSLLLARSDLAELTRHTAGDIHPPFYYYLLHFWGEFSGWSEFSSAFLSLFFGVLLIALVYRVTREWLQGYRDRESSACLPLTQSANSIALVAAVLVAVSSYNVWYSQEVRMYTLGAALGLISVYFLRRMLDPARTSIRDFLGYVLSTALGIYTLYYFAFLVVFEYLLVALRIILTPGQDRLRRLPTFAASQLVIALLYLPWLPIAIRQATDPPVPPWREFTPLFNVLGESFSALVLGQSVDPLQVAPFLMLVLVLIAFLFIPLRAAARRSWGPVPIYLFLLAYTFVPLSALYLLSLWKPLYHVRYIFTYSPAFYILLAMAIFTGARRVANARIRAGAGAWARPNPPQTLPSSHPPSGARPKGSQEEEARLLLVPSSPSSNLAAPESREQMSRKLRIPGTEWNGRGQLAGRGDEPAAPLTSRAPRIGSLLIAGALAAYALSNAYSLGNFWFNPQYADDDLRGAVQLLADNWRPGDVILVNAGYAYPAVLYYYPTSLARPIRLVDYQPSPNDARTSPIVLTTGSIDGGPHLGWGDPLSDFYPTTASATVAALGRVTRSHMRVWMLRLYDTVTDPSGAIRQYLADYTRLIEDEGFTGESNARVQGFLTMTSLTLPADATALNARLSDRVKLLGFTSDTRQAKAGSPYDVTLYWQPLETLNENYQLSLQIIDAGGRVVAQHDETPLGNVLPTSRWRPGQIYPEPVRLELPRDVPSGDYAMIAKLYNLNTGQVLGDPVSLLGLNVVQ